MEKLSAFSKINFEFLAMYDKNCPIFDDLTVPEFCAMCLTYIFFSIYNVKRAYYYCKVYKN